MKIIHNLASVITFGVLFAIGFGNAAAAETKLLYNNFLSPFDPAFKVGFTDFAKAIEEETGGSVTVTIPDSSVAPPNRQYEIIREGIADMAMVSMANVSQFVTLNQLAELPRMAPSAAAASSALWATYKKYFEPLGQFKGVKVLATPVLPGRQLINVGGKEIAGTADLEGQKIWANTAGQQAAAKALNAVPMVIQFPDLQDYASKGQVDQLFISAGSAESARVMEQAKSVTNLQGGFGSVAFAIFISQEIWDGLSSEEQAGIERAAKGLSHDMGAAFDQDEQAAIDKTGDLKTIDLNGAAAAEFDTALDAALQDWKAIAIKSGLENPDAVVAFYREELAQYAAE